MTCCNNPNALLQHLGDMPGVRVLFCLYLFPSLTPPYSLPIFNPFPPQLSPSPFPNVATTTMAAALRLLSLTQLQRLAHSQHNQNLMAASWVWNPQEAADDDSWEVRAFAQDTGNVMGTTWPPRSYTCTFCRREFRSAQALGGHMNVHRRDRARLHQTHPPAPTVPLINQTSSSTTQDFVSDGGLCLLYQIPTPNGAFNSPSMNPCSLDSTSPLLSMSPYPSNNLMAPPPPPYINYPATPPGLHNSSSADNNISSMETSIEELDLELRLGQRPTPS
ncbi:hypothetical protein E1A91_D08G194100v1 [Gossypium mustelinum]|uniref:C2H2-type domain-containing protein n=1 Tax=Gossypium mustelinum TaxID=34275 RepID=A0A5D2TYW2_GOSMU|nr:hypothetical protein E1A91_D08G194100v1 [Gossypium mustelinum]